MGKTKTLRIERLPDLLERKLYKTGQTRGATPREIYQNRVSRSSTVLIPLDFWESCAVPSDGTDSYENGAIALVSPDFYFNTPDVDQVLERKGLKLGDNALLLFLKRSDWVDFAPPKGAKLPNGQLFVPANSRTAPLGGVYISRIHSTTSASGAAMTEGYNQTEMRGAGIRVYEYASARVLAETRLQLEALLWLCYDSEKVLLDAGMSELGLQLRKSVQLEKAREEGLLDRAKLRDARMIDNDGRTICPLCLDLISASEFMQRGEQAEGRETWDITVTEVSLFHIEELRVGQLQHKPYNLGWGHHFCNVVVKDSGLLPTLDWMKRVIKNNEALNA
jgi:hypothetical protein